MVVQATFEEWFQRYHFGTTKCQHTSHCQHGRTVQLQTEGEKDARFEISVRHEICNGYLFMS